MCTHHVQTRPRTYAQNLYYNRAARTRRCTHCRCQTWHTHGRLPRTEPASASQVNARRGAREHPDKGRTSVNTRAYSLLHMYCPQWEPPVPSPLLNTHVVILHLRLLTLPRLPSSAHSQSIRNTSRNAHRPCYTQTLPPWSDSVHTRPPLRNDAIFPCPGGGGKFHRQDGKRLKPTELSSSWGLALNPGSAPQLHRPQELGGKWGVVSRPDVFS